MSCLMWCLLYAWSARNSGQVGGGKCELYHELVVEAGYLVWEDTMFVLENRAIALGEGYGRLNGGMRINMGH